jgi:hypothetical protein
VILKKSLWSRRVDGFSVYLENYFTPESGCFDLPSAIATQYGDVILSTSMMLPDVSIKCEPDLFGFFWPSRRVLQSFLPYPQNIEVVCLWTIYLRYVIVIIAGASESIYKCGKDVIGSRRRQSRMQQVSSVATKSDRSC